jgi:hypothetical protein
MYSRGSDVLMRSKSMFSCYKADWLNTVEKRRRGKQISSSPFYPPIAIVSTRLSHLAPTTQSSIAPCPIIKPVQIRPGFLAFWHIWPVGTLDCRSECSGADSRQLMSRWIPGHAVVSEERSVSRRDGRRDCRGYQSRGRHGPKTEARPAMNNLPITSVPRFGSRIMARVSLRRHDSGWL